MPEKQGSYIKLGILVLIILVVILVSSFIIKPKNTPTLISPVFLQGINLTSTFNFAFKSRGLSNLISKDLEGPPAGRAGKSGEYAIYIEDLSDLPAGRQVEVYTLNSSDSFPAASLYKLYLIAAILKKVDDGDLALSDTLSAPLSHLVDVYGDLDFGYEDSGDTIQYSVDEALTRVGRISDNFASIMLMDKIGPDKVQQVADSLGATNTQLKFPITTSASDIGTFFKALYKGEVVNKKVSDELVRFLELNQLNDRIPALLPEETKIIHKTGELAGVRNDAGIVYLENRPYVIVLMSKDLQYEDDGVETLAQISKDVFEYFKGKSVN